MESLSLEMFRRWKDSCGSAYVEKASQTIGGLIAEQGVHYKTPFDQPLRGPPAISLYRRCAAALAMLAPGFNTRST